MDPSHHFYHLRGLKGFKPPLQQTATPAPKKATRHEASQTGFRAGPSWTARPCRGWCSQLSAAPGVHSKTSGAGPRLCHSPLLLLNEVNTYRGATQRALVKNCRVVQQQSWTWIKGIIRQGAALANHMQTHIPGRLPKIKPIKIQSFLYCVLSTSVCWWCSSAFSVENIQVAASSPAAAHISCSLINIHFFTVY